MSAHAGCSIIPKTFREAVTGPEKEFWIPGVKSESKSHCDIGTLGSLRMLIALASRLRLNLHNIDIKTAFLYGLIDADINCEIPGGIREFLGDTVAHFDDPVLQLQRAIYGLRQAGYVWLKTYVNSLKSWGFKQCQTDPCDFVKTITDKR